VRAFLRRVAASAPPESFFVGSAVFHYLGPAFAVLLFARVEPLGVAWLRIASAAVVFAVWRRPWRLLRNRTVIAMGLVLAAMNPCFYIAIDRLPLGTVAAIEFLPVIALAALGMRTLRNGAALLAAVGGVYLLTDVRLEGEPVGVVFAFLNAALFALYIVLAHRVAQGGMGGIDGLAAAMLVAWLFVLPVGGWDAAPALLDPVALAAGIGVGISSSVIPYVFDQLAMARMRRATYALLVSLLPATATVIGVIVLGQIPSPVEVVGVALVVGAVAVHREPSGLDSGRVASSADPVPGASPVPAGLRGRDEAGPARDGGRGRPEDLPDRAREGPAGERIRGGCGGGGQLPQGRAGA
jgi:inner membrane transporter RhtA